MVSKDDCNEIYRLYNLGYSLRAIANEVFGNPNRNSTVYYIVERYKNRELVDDSTPLLNKNQPNVLFFDIETSPNLSYHFAHWNINIRPEHKVRESHILSVAYAFNNEPVVGYKLSVKDIENQDDLTPLVNLVDAINKSDIIVGYNSKKFDLKYINTRALYYGLKPIKPVKHIDLYEQVRKNFSFPSNAMGNVSKYLGLEGKLAHEGFKMWSDALSYKNVDVCESALTKMLDYNKQDIEATRDLYYKLQGWFKQVPNVGLIANVKSGAYTMRCSKCGHDDVSPLDGELYYTTANAFQLYRCNNCQGISRQSKKSLTGCI